ncbi:MAG: T9SS type A sorting domain-containing protein, partial [Aliifodinibius sp.]|nr:T9SS type A sorting domain-containing protein [Fodinibius sp.]NIV12178.1 T9SS type A sorting domain-containing protein [Fodinibius sp.]NIY25838.1 T9SS type A sorting domain-containing protein [Fodinibius sp.]
DEFLLFQNYPNPFNPVTNIEFYLPSSDRVELVISNVLGQRIRTLFTGKIPAGTHSFSWDGINDSGSLVASGVYIYQLTTSDGQQAKKMLFIR